MRRSRPRTTTCNIRRYVDNSPAARAARRARPSARRRAGWRRSMPWHHYWTQLHQAALERCFRSARKAMRSIRISPRTYRQARHRRPDRQRHPSVQACHKAVHADHSDAWWQKQPAPGGGPGPEPDGKKTRQRLRPAPRPCSPSIAETFKDQDPAQRSIRCGAPLPTTSSSSRPTSNPLPPAAGDRS